MFSIILTLFLIAFLFFGLIPGIGAFLIRARWHHFRQRMIHSSLLSLADYSLLHEAHDRTQLGSFRFFGTLESIQGENRLWVTNNAVTVGIDVTKTFLYLLRSYPAGDTSARTTAIEETLPDEEPEYLPVSYTHLTLPTKRIV